MAPITGHSALITALQKLLDDAKAYTFHDFRTSLATPKLELDRRLTAIAQHNRAGTFDNKPGDE